MNNLTIDAFISAAVDPEFSKYKILAALKNYSEKLHKNKLYPAYPDLTDLYNGLKDLLKRKDTLTERFPKKLIGYDLESRKAIYEKKRVTTEQVDRVFKLISWTLPKLQESVNEAKAIYDFVNENLSIAEIGVLPIYKNEGYFTLPNRKQKKLMIYNYRLSIITSSDIPLQTLKTNYVDSFKNLISEELPQDIKLQLIKKFPDLPNPAAYSFEIEIDFPLTETLLPVAKRKLMKQLAA